MEVEGAEWLSPGNWPTQVTIPIGATVHEFTVETNDDDAERENGAITVRVLAGSEYEVTDADAGEASIEINDNDTRSLVLSRSSLEVPEAGSANYTVKLVSEPSADVTVDITGHSDTDLTLDPASASLTFTTTNWATAQTVVVSAAQDSDATHDRATLTHTASGGGYDSVTRGPGGSRDRHHARATGGRGRGRTRGREQADTCDAPHASRRRRHHHRCGGPERRHRRRQGRRVRTERQHDVDDCRRDDGEHRGGDLHLPG